MADAKANPTLTDEELDGLVVDGHVKLEDRQKVRTRAAERTERSVALACNVTWQTGNCRREVLAPDACQLFERFGCLAEEQDAHERPIFLVSDGYHRTIIINPTALDHICVPAHKFRKGEMQEAEVELNDA